MSYYQGNPYYRQNQTKKAVEKKPPVKVETPEESFELSNAEATRALARLEKIFTPDQFSDNKKCIPTQSVEDLAAEILKLAQEKQNNEDLIDIRGMDDFLTDILDKRHLGSRQQQKQQYQYQQQREASFRGKGNVNTKSKQLLSKKEYQPIHIRSNQVIKEKKEKIAKLQQQKQLKQEEKAEKEVIYNFQPQMSSQQTRPNRSINEFLTDIENWNEMKKQKHINRQFQALAQQQNIATFKPELNKKSLQIMQKQAETCPNGFGRATILERMETQKIEKKEKQKAIELQLYSKCSFAPTFQTRKKRTQSTGADKKIPSKSGGNETSLSPQKADVTSNFLQFPSSQSPANQNRSMNEHNYNNNSPSQKSGSSPNRRIVYDEDTSSPQRGLIGNLSQAFLADLGEALAKEKQRMNDSTKLNHSKSSIIGNNHKRSDASMYEELAQSFLLGKSQQLREEGENNHNNSSIQKSQKMDESIVRQSPQKRDNKYERSQSPQTTQRKQKRNQLSSSPNKYENPQEAVEISAQEHRNEIKKKLRFYRQVQEQLMQGMHMSDAIKYCEQKQQKQQQQQQQQQQQHQHKGRESNQSPQVRRSNSPKKPTPDNLNDALNQVPYHPNLDFIINMLKKTDAPTQKRSLASSASANNLSQNQKKVGGYASRI